MSRATILILALAFGLCLIGNLTVTRNLFGQISPDQLLENVKKLQEEAEKQRAYQDKELEEVAKLQLDISEIESEIAAQEQEMLKIKEKYKQYEGTIGPEADAAASRAINEIKAVSKVFEERNQDIADIKKTQDEYRAKAEEYEKEALRLEGEANALIQKPLYDADKMLQKSRKARKDEDKLKAYNELMRHSEKMVGLALALISQSQVLMEKGTPGLFEAAKKRDLALDFLKKSVLVLGKSYSLIKKLKIGRITYVCPKKHTTSKKPGKCKKCKKKLIKKK